MKYLYILIKLLLVAVLMYACDKDETPIPKLTIKPFFDQSSGKQGDTMHFEIQGNSNDGLKSIQIQEFMEGTEPVTLLDSAIKSSSLKHTYHYLIANKLNYKGYRVVLNFRLEDNDGDVTSVFREIIVLNSSRILTATDTQVVYSGYSGKANGYNIEGLAVVPAGTAASDVDFQDNPVNSTSGLEYRWTSPANGQFVLAPTFDFTNATDSSVIKAYKLANKLSVVSGFKKGDVILTRLGNVSSGDSIYAAIKVADVVDSAGTSADRYILSIKK